MRSLVTPAGAPLSSGVETATRGPSPVGPGPSVALLKFQNYSEWSTARELGERSGSLGPYSVDHLAASGFRLRYTDRATEGVWSWSPLRRGVDGLSKISADLAGVRNVLANLDLIARTDWTVSVFEDQGFFAAWMKARGLWRRKWGRLAIAACWLSDTIGEVGPAELRRLQKSLTGVDKLIYFSENQTALYLAVGVPRDRLCCVDLGIDAAFFSPSRPARDSTGHGVLAIGRDRGRNHEMLVEAVRGTDIPLTIVAPELRSKNLPANVTHIKEKVDHRQYRDLLEAAAVVAVPTYPSNYPTGQTVLLEAMAMGRAVLMSDSPALAGYVRDSQDAFLVSGDSPDVWRSEIFRLLDDDALRADVGRAAREQVLRRFTQDRMWAQIASALLDQGASADSWS